MRSVLADFAAISITIVGIYLVFLFLYAVYGG